MTPHKIFHLNLRRCLHDTMLCVVVSVASLPRVCIHNYYHCMIVIWINLNIKSKMNKTEGLVKWIIDYLRRINILWCRMGVIYMKQHLAWTWLHYVNIYNPSMHCHTGNTFCIFVLISHVLIFQTNNVCIFTITICIFTLEMCVVLLC